VNAIQEWAKVKALEMALERPSEKQSAESAEPIKTKTFKGKTCPSCGATGLGYKLKVCSTPACGYVFKKDSADQPDQQPSVSQEQPTKTPPEAGSTA
jgi:hypothetical protein